MSNAPGGPDWFQASNGKWYPPQLPKPPEAPWVGPTAWLLFLGGIGLAFALVGSIGALVGVILSLVGLIMLAATGRVIPGRR